MDEHHSLQPAEQGQGAGAWMLNSHQGQQPAWLQLDAPSGPQQGFQHPNLGSPFQPVHLQPQNHYNLAPGSNTAAHESLAANSARPLLPPDGPLLNQQSSSPDGAISMPDPHAHFRGPPGFDVHQIQHWIHAFSHLPNSATLAGIPGNSGILMPGPIIQQQAGDGIATRPEAGEGTIPRTSPAFQGTGAFAPLRPHSQHAELSHASDQQQQQHDSSKATAQFGFPVSHHQSGQDGIWSGQDLEQPTQNSATKNSHAAASNYLPHQFGQPQEPLPVPGDHQQLSQQHQTFEQLVEHAASQASQGNGAPGQQSPSASAAAMRSHKPPQQATKSSRFRGVYKRQRGGRWEASIVLDGKNCRLGLHLTEVAAAQGYDRVAIKKWGPNEAANKINFPVSNYNLAELEAISMTNLVAAVRAEWREKSDKNTAALGVADRMAEAETPMGLLRDPAEPSTGEYEGPFAKRARTDDSAAGEMLSEGMTDIPNANGTGIAFAQTAEEEEETQQRVPIPRSSLYRGVSTHKQSGKWVSQIKASGKQVYLGFYTNQVDAARAYDQAVIHMQGEKAETNFPLEEYSDRMQQLQDMPFKELVAALKQNGRGGAPRQPKTEASQYRGVAPDKSKKWRAQITTSAKTTVYLGLWSDEVGAARAYDRANLAKRGESARTNFPASDYASEIEQLRVQPFEGLVAQLRAEAVASVAADRAARRDLPAPGTILAPMRPPNQQARPREDSSYQLQESNGGQTTYSHNVIGPDPAHQRFAQTLLPHHPETHPSFQLSQQGHISRFGADQNQGLPRGYVIGRNISTSRPDMLFRVVNRNEGDDPVLQQQ